MAERRQKEERPRLALSRGRMNTFIAGGCWIVALAIAIVGFKGKSAVSNDRGIQMSYVESEETQQSRANMVIFRRQAPRTDLMQQVAPWGKRNPLGMTIYLSSKWNQEPDATQKRLLNTWAALWFASAKPGHSKRATPEFWLRRGRGRQGRMIGHLKPEDLRLKQG